MDPQKVGVGEVVSLRIQRNDPSGSVPKKFQMYTVKATKFMRIMDALEEVRENDGSDLAFRAYCGAKRCGGCGMKMNGKPVLACWEPVEKDMTLEPLDNFPVIRDLVVDTSAYDKAKALLHPLLERKEPYSGFPERINHQEMIPSFKLMDCIECQLCTSACTVLKKQNFRDNGLAGNGFAGPAAMVQLAKVALHPRGDPRIVESALVGNIQDCLSCNDCSEVCPNHIDVLRDAIDELREGLITRGKYEVRGWSVIRRMPPKLRSFIRCNFGLTLGEKVILQKADNK